MHTHNCLLVILSPYWLKAFNKFGRMSRQLIFPCEKLTNVARFTSYDMVVKTKQLTELSFTEKYLPKVTVTLCILKVDHKAPNCTT